MIPKLDPKTEPKSSVALARIKSSPPEMLVHSTNIVTQPTMKRIIKLKYWAMATTLVLLSIGAFRYGTDQRTKRHLVQRLVEQKRCVGCDLRGVNLSGLDLNGTNLQGANLAGVNLTGAQLGNAILTDANLTQANLTDADLGCATVNFNLRADPQTAAVDLTVDAATPDAVRQRDHILDFDFDANQQGATLSFNFGGCTNLQGANLTGAILPDGSVF